MLQSRVVLRMKARMLCAYMQRAYMLQPCTVALFSEALQWHGLASVMGAYRQLCMQPCLLVHQKKASQSPPFCCVNKMLKPQLVLCHAALPKAAVGLHCS